ncbi:Protein SRG1 [Morus notabilis]|uniref:Protein SRG1 n=1 Tax=Morus notabilis TaxID=981085 RepID=W9SQQ4_9ROSA|nr:flavanone 3-dioxygenase 3 [Morus notabilis]EXC21066.1 Protein SRG1 [Morus notabilis]
MEDEGDSNCFRAGESAQEKGLPYVPECYKIPTSDRASSSPEMAKVPLVDLAGLRKGPQQRAIAIEAIKDACLRLGFFQIVNHGICQSVLDDALSSAFDFFRLPAAEKVKFMSNDVHTPVRYGTSLKDGADKIQFWRVFLKQYAHPLEDFIESWPTNPPTYREKMGRYCKEVRKLGLELMGAITESLELGPNYLSEKLESGMQVMAVNCYPPCPNPDLALGLPPHSDYSCLTIVLQSSPGLEIMDAEAGADGWRLIPDLRGVLQVHVGDHFEVLSNGTYKSLVHRATLNRERTRISVASLHSLGMDEKMGPAEELVDDQERKKKYKESSFGDFLNFLATNDIAEGKTFINTLKIEN